MSYTYGKDNPQKEKMDYLDFIARVTSRIPEKSQVMIRYYGLYANTHRGKKRKTGIDNNNLPVIEEEIHPRPHNFYLWYKM